MWRSIIKHLSGIVIFSIIYYVGENFGQFWGPIKRRPFLCEDSSVKGPYLKDTINSRALYVIGLYIPVAVIILNEFIQHKWIEYKKFQNLKWLDRFLINLCAALLPFLYGFATERLLKNLAKFTVARLRPHFYTLCQPITSKGVPCLADADYSSPFYVTNYTCSSTSASSIDSAFSSFPSGHSSLAFYGMIFAVLYLQRFSQLVHRNVTNYGLLLVVVQLFCLVLALSVAVSRVFDFRHFWSDIFAGSALGTLIAVIFSFYREKNMKAIDLHMAEGEMATIELTHVKTVNEETAANDLDQVKYTANEGDTFKEGGCSIEMIGS